MTETLLPRMFTIEIDGKPTLVFRAKNLQELPRRTAGRRSERAGDERRPICNASAKLTARIAPEAETAIYLDAGGQGD